MLRRIRSSKRRHEVTLDVLIAALDREAWIDYWGDEEEAANAWEALRWHPSLARCDPFASDIEDEEAPRLPPPEAA